MDHTFLYNSCDNIVQCVEDETSKILMFSCKNRNKIGIFMRKRSSVIVFQIYNYSIIVNLACSMVINSRCQKVVRDSLLLS